MESKTKFQSILDLAFDFGFAVTGHYARLFVKEGKFPNNFNDDSMLILVPDEFLGRQFAEICYPTGLWGKFQYV